MANNRNDHVLIILILILMIPWVNILIGKEINWVVVLFQEIDSFECLGMRGRRMSE